MPERTIFVASCGETTGDNYIYCLLNPFLIVTTPKIVPTVPTWNKMNNFKRTILFHVPICGVLPRPLLRPWDTLNIMERNKILDIIFIYHCWKENDIHRCWVYLLLSQCKENCYFIFFCQTIYLYLYTNLIRLPHMFMMIKTIEWVFNVVEVYPKNVKISLYEWFNYRL